MKVLARLLGADRSLPETLDGPDPGGIGASSTLEASGQRSSAGRLESLPSSWPHPTGSLTPGQLLGGYQIVALIGEGGVGEVYQARHVQLGRMVAIKHLREEFSANQGVLRRFFDEALAANQIAHENIVEITDYVWDEENGAYLIMELLRGQDLDEAFEDAGTVDVQRTIGIMIQVASALTAAHRVGIIHRDLKPDNIFLTHQGGHDDFVKLLDFGVAKLGDRADRDVRATLAGTVVGTPAYMSPEQALGHPVDHRTDIFAFGAIIYELITGRLPFQGESLGEFVIAHAITTPIPPSQIPDLPHTIPPVLEELTLSCLAREPDARPQSMVEIELWLREIASGDHEAISIAPKRSRVLRGLGLGIMAAVTFAVVLVAAWPVLDSGGLLATVALVPEQTLVEPRIEVTPLSASEPAIEPEAQPESTSVSIRFESVPEGAEVWPDGAAARMGVTPFEASFPQTETLLAFEFKLDGYETVRQDVQTAADATTSAVLERSPRRRPPSRFAAAEDPGRRGVIRF